MRNLFLIGAAALAFTAAPAVAQNDMAGQSYEWTDTQKSMYDRWPADRRTAYDAWPPEVQEYYWTLQPTQAEGWWMLNDNQRLRIYEMTPQQQATAWTQIATQMNAAPAASSRSTAGANMRFVSNAVVQNTPGDQGPPTGEVPICSANEQDNCINAWEAGKRGPGVTKPLGYWPGKPASKND